MVDQEVSFGGSGTSWDSATATWDSLSTQWDDLGTSVTIDQTGHLFSFSVTQKVDLSGGGEAFQLDTFQHSAFKVGTGFRGFIDQSGVLFAPTYRLVTVRAGLINQSGIVFTPEFSRQVDLDLIDQSGVLFEFLLSVAQEVDLDFIDQSGSLFDPAVNVSFVELDLLDYSPILFSPDVQFSLALDLLDYSPELFDHAVFVGFHPALDLIDQSGTLFALSIPNQDVVLGLLDQSGVLFDLVVILPPAPQTELPFIDQTAILFAVRRIATEVPVAVLLVGRWDPDVRKTGRWDHDVELTGRFR